LIQSIKIHLHRFQSLKANLFCDASGGRVVAEIYSFAAIWKIWF
jgi:hypothetical protein